MHEEDKQAYTEEYSEELTAKAANKVKSNAGFDYSKDFVWGSDQDEYIDES